MSSPQKTIFSCFFGMSFPSLSLDGPTALHLTHNKDGNNHHVLSFSGEFLSFFHLTMTKASLVGGQVPLFPRWMVSPPSLPKG